VLSDLDNNYVDALVKSSFAILALLVMAGIFMLSTVVMHRGVAFIDKRGGFKLRRGAKHVKKDDKRNVVIAAAVTSYLQAEQERKR